MQVWFHHIFNDLLYCVLGVILAFWGLHYAWLMLAKLLPNHWAGGYLRLQPAGRAILVRAVRCCTLMDCSALCAAVCVILHGFPAAQFVFRAKQQRSKTDSSQLVQPDSGAMRR